MALLVTSDLALDLKAASLTLSDGASVTAWPDSAPAANTSLLSGTAPVYRTGMTPSGGPAVRFSTGAFHFTGNVFNYIGGTPSAEMFAVVRCAVGANDNQGFYQFGGGYDTYYPYLDGNVYDGSFTYFRYSFPAVTPTQWHIYNVSHDGTTRTTSIDGTVVHTVNVSFTYPANAGAGAVRVGRSAATWQGDIAEVVGYNRALTSTERTQVLSYLQAQHFAPDPKVQAPPVQARILLSPPESARPGIAAPAMTLSVGITATGSDPAPTNGPVTAPRVQLSVTLPTPDSHQAADQVEAPPLTLTVTLTASAAAAHITASSPADGDVLVIGRPTFVVALSALDATTVYTVEVQYADNPAFTGASTLSADASGVDGGVFLTPTSAVAATTYWRARLLQDGVEQVGWTTAAGFTVDTAVSAVRVPVMWAVDTGAARPLHLWHLDPPGPDIGDTVTVYGQGFPATGHLSFGDDLLDVQSWTRVPAQSSNTGDTTRLIDAGTVTCEHYEITFVAPVYDGPGAALTVEP